VSNPLDALTRDQRNTIAAYVEGSCMIADDILGMIREDYKITAEPEHLDAMLTELDIFYCEGCGWYLAVEEMRENGECGDCNEGVDPD
jgi:hypothetical protein